jgi:hypothetical protein
MTMRLEVFGGRPGVVERLIGREGFHGDEAAAAPLRLGMVTVVVEQPPAT